MKKIKLTEADLVTLVERVIKEDGHTDIPSAIRKCKLIMDDAGDIMEKLIELSETGGSLPSWWMDKVTLAADYLNKADDYINTTSHVHEQTKKKNVK